jgi:transcription initiation factor TFIIIB Brf1 subunit/transcription initiation factor TFIIB
MPTCPTCSGTIIEYSASAGNGFCVSCGTVVEENTIVNEITFGETGSGAAMVQGSYVGQGASEFSDHQRRTLLTLMQEVRGWEAHLATGETWNPESKP